MFHKFNSVLIVSTRRQHPIPQVKDSVPQDWPLVQYQLKVQVTYTSDQLALDQRLPYIPFGFILLEQLTELRGTFHFLDFVDPRKEYICQEGLPMVNRAQIHNQSPAAIVYRGLSRTLHFAE